MQTQNHDEEISKDTLLDGIHFEVPSNAMMVGQVRVPIVDARVDMLLVGISECNHYEMTFNISIHFDDPIAARAAMHRLAYIASSASGVPHRLMTHDELVQMANAFGINA